jgi:predicted metal-dependent hydrolase
MEPELEEFISLFNNKEFFDAHEVLEQLWLETEGEDKNFYKGLIQCAVALAHLQRGNRKGADKVCGTACAYLDRYPSAYLGIQNEALVQQMRDFFANANPDLENPPVVNVSNAGGSPAN